MAEYLIQEETLTALGDGVRGISGTTGAMSTETMTSHLVSANSTIEEQADLLSQIQSALEGKAAGGGSVETCTVTIHGDQDVLYDTYLSYTEVTDEGLNPVVGYFCAPGYDAATGTVTVECALNTVLTLYSWNKLLGSAHANDVLTANTADGSTYMFGLTQSAVSISVS